jgi:hypothetical protein
MVNKVNKLVTKFTADTKQFNNNVDKAKKRVKLFGKEATDMGMKLKKSLKIAAASFAAFGAAGAAALGGIIREINQTSIELDSMIKTARKLNIAVSDLQRLQFQAELAGVKTETLNMALQRMARRVAEASADTGEAVDALEELNLNARLLAKLSPDKQFEEIAKAMKKIGNENQQLRLAFKLFDSEGVALVNLFRTNIEEAGAAFDALGISLSNKQVKAIEKYRDTVSTLSAAWSGFKAIITAEVAPVFTDLIKNTFEYIKAAGGIQPIAARFANFIVRMTQGLVQSLQIVGGWIDWISKKITMVQNEISGVLNRFALVGRAISAGTTDPGVIGTLQGMQGPTNAIQQPTSDFTGIFDSIKGPAMDSGPGIIAIDITADANLATKIAASSAVGAAISTQVKSLTSSEAASTAAAEEI